MASVSEEWILEQLEADEPDVTALLQAIDTALEDGRKDTAETWAQLALDAFAERGDYDTALAALARLYGESKSGERRKECIRTATGILSRDREKRRMIENSGFDQNIPVVECIRRLRLLCSLKPGKFCYDATWGQGIITRVDIFYHRVEIDFERKREHQLSLSYAAETLELLSPDHFLSLCHTAPEKVLAMSTEAPAELVRLVIASMGAMTPEALHTELVPRAIPESKWKTFWSSARKDLKKDPLFELPPKRKDPMRILESEEELFGSIWFNELKVIRDMDEIIDKLELCGDSLKSMPTDETILEIIANRLNFVIIGAGIKQPVLPVRATMLALRFNIPASAVDTGKVWDKYMHGDILKRTTDQLTARHLKPFLVKLLEHGQEEAVNILINQLPVFQLLVLTEIVDLLVKSGYEELVAQAFLKVVSNREINARMLLWVLKHPDEAKRWKLGSNANLTPLVFSILEKEHTNDSYTDFTRLRKFCEKNAWIEKVMNGMNQLQRKEFTVRVMDSSGWSPLDRKSMLGYIIKIDPSMQKVVAPSAKAGDKAPTGQFTSLRSYHQRRLQLENMINKEIPDNSREIGEARSHGDLRENAEFKAAKERQGLLLQRQAEIEEQLNKVQPTDFIGFSSERVGPGTMVTIEYNDGNTTQYAVLGEWDSDEEMNIIPSSSLLAVKLKGHQPGDRVIIPTEHGETEAMLTNVEGLTDQIRVWIADVG